MATGYRTRPFLRGLPSRTPPSPERHCDQALWEPSLVSPPMWPHLPHLACQDIKGRGNRPAWGQGRSQQSTGICNLPWLTLGGGTSSAFGSSGKDDEVMFRIALSFPSHNCTPHGGAGAGKALRGFVSTARRPCNVAQDELWERKYPKPHAIRTAAGK